MNIFYQDNHITQYLGDFRENDLPDECVQMVATSPPYWGLRKYSGEQDLIWGGDNILQCSLCNGIIAVGGKDNELRILREGDTKQNQQGKQENVQPKMLNPFSDEGRQVEYFSEGEQTGKGKSKLEGGHQENRGIHNDTGEESPSCCEGLCDGASVSHGGNDRQVSNERRSGASHQCNQRRQPTGEPTISGSAHTQRAGGMPLLPKDIRNKLACPFCHTEELKQIDCQHEWNMETISAETFARGGHVPDYRYEQPLRSTRPELWQKVTHKRGFCSLCGAWRGAYGLEPTPEMYVQHTVEILREIRRVLRKDGVVFLNLGDSYYASGGAHKPGHANPGLSKSAQRGGVPHGKQPIQSLENVPACGNDGKEFLNWKDCDCACSCHDDERQDLSLSHIARNDRQPDIEPSQSGKKAHDRQHRDSSLVTAASVPHASQESSKPSSSQVSLENPSVRFCSDCLKSHYLASYTSNPLGTLYHIPKLKAKDLCLIPFRVAIAAQEDGWWVRSDIIWSKPNPMPESVTDRPTNSHEYILMLTKSAKYYWDADAVREPHKEASLSRDELGYNAAFKGRHTMPGEKRPNSTDHEGFCNPAGRNIRSVWEFNEGDEQGGKVYKVSQGCPVHSPLLHPDILQTLRDGEPLDCLLSHTLDRYNCLVPVLSASLLSKICHTSEDDHLSKMGFHHHGSELSQIIENTDENKMSLICYHGGGHISCLETPYRTKNNGISDGCQVYNSGYPYPFGELLATEHSREIHKTVSLIATNDSVFLEIPDRIVHILQSLGCTCSYNHYTTSHFPLQDVWSFSTQPYKEAHFAVFPEKLPETCIKAASPEVGCCSKCGAPWERITERVDKGWDGSRYGENAVAASGGAKSGGTAQSTLGSSHGQLVGSQQTLGWQPTCKCNADKVPSIVLDPFAGSGTTLWVAKKLGRKAIGFDTSEEYCELNRKRNMQQVMI